MIHIYLNHIPEQIERLVVVVNIFTTGGQFTDVQNAYIRLLDDRPGTRNDVELARFALTGQIPTNGLIFAALHRMPNENGGGWKMLAMGEVPRPM
jgi:stress response protein SCP2